MSKVETIYTGKELYHLTDSNGSYDAKISAKGDGSYDYYATNSNWKDHSHEHVDKNGNTTYYRDEGYNHSWEHRQAD